MINTKWNANGPFNAITHPNATEAMAEWYRDIIIIDARTVNKGVVDIEDNESCERLKIHTVPLIQYMGNGPECLQMMREEFEEQYRSTVIPTQARWLVSPRTFRERRQTEAIAASSVVFIVKGS